MAMQTGVKQERQQAFGWLGGRTGGPQSGKVSPPSVHFPLASARALVGRLQRRPFAIGGLVVGAGIAMGAAAILGRRSPQEAATPEEIVARALCREDPDTPTYRGPLWTGYRKDAQRVLAALRQAELLTNGA